MSDVVEVIAETISPGDFAVARRVYASYGKPLETQNELTNTAIQKALDTIAALDAAGFVVVPKEPTPEMRGAGTELLCSGGLVYGQDIDDTVVIETAAARCVYEVMLRAAP